MKSGALGRSTSPVEVTNISPHGFWLFIDDRTDPYFMQVTPEGKVAGRETIRETIRARGPTNHPMFGKQAGNN
jgi:hypothetical protein